MNRCLIGLALFSIAFSPAVVVGAPSTMAGWPVPAGAGTVHPGPGGGVVVIEEDGESRASSVAAFQLNGRRLWVNSGIGICFGCRDRSQSPQLQLDGDYGPIGPTPTVLGSSRGTFWGVTNAGLRVDGCNGLALVDGTCVRYDNESVTAMRGSTLVWTYSSNSIRFSFSPELQSRPPIDHDAAGNVYVQGSRGAGVVALDAATGVHKWEIPGAFLKVALSSGAVILQPDVGLVRVQSDGTTVWTRPAWKAASAAFVYADEARGRVYVSPESGNGITALDAATGAQLWKTRVDDRARLLSIDSRGIVYASTQRGSIIGGLYTLRAVNPNGAVRWQWPSVQIVTGALGRSDGTVAVATTAHYSSLGLIWRIDPRKPAPSVRQARFALSRTRIRTRCTKPGCHFNPALGTVLTVSVPGPTRFTIALFSGGKQRTLDKAFQVPAGNFRLRELGDKWTSVARGRYQLEIRGTMQGRAFVQRLPLTVI